MTGLAALCDVSYAILVERSEQVALAAMAAGAEDADLGVAREHLDRMLQSPLGYRDAEDREQAELIVALGLGRR